MVVDHIRVIALVATFVYASYLDIESRIIPDYVWIPASILAVGLIAYDATQRSIQIVVSEAVFSVLVIGGIAYILYHFKIFYGADYKGFVLIGLLLPVTPEIFGLPVVSYDVGSVDPEIYFDRGLTEYLSSLNSHLGTQLFGFTVLVNSSIFGLTYFVSNIYHNIRTGDFTLRKPLRSTCARSVDSTSITDMHAQVIKETESENPVFRGIEFIRNGINGVSSDFYRDYLEWHRGKKFNSPNDEISDIESIDLEGFGEDSEGWTIVATEEDKKLAELPLDRDNLWVTPGIPFIVPMTLGIISALVLGNIFYIILL